MRNPNQGGGDHDAYNGTQDSPPLGPSRMLDQHPVSAPTPLSPTVMPQPTIPDAESIEMAPDAEFAPLASNTPNAETIPPVPLTLAPALDQDITTSSRPLLASQLLTLMMPYGCGPKTLNTDKPPSTTKF